MTMRRIRSSAVVAVLTLAGAAAIAPVQAHHSFAMYDQQKTYVFTGVVTRVTPDASHLQIFFVPLDDKRAAVVRDAAGQPVVWTVELHGAGTVAREGLDVKGGL